MNESIGFPADPARVFLPVSAPESDADTAEPPERPPVVERYGFGVNVRVIATRELLASGITQIEAREFCRRWNSGQPSSATWAAFEPTAKAPPKLKPKSDEGDAEDPGYLPTPAEIRVGCGVIRQTWSEAEHRRRSAWPDQRWTLPGLERPVRSRAEGR